MWILGVDGGATKTTVALATDDLARIEQVTAGPTNPHLVGLDAAARTIAEALSALRARSGAAEIAAAAFGAAGLDHPRQIEAYRAAVAPLAPGARLRVVNDVIIAYHSGTDAADGIALIAGTGSHGYGRARGGREAFAGGLDWRLADEGSAYAIGDAALRAVVRAADGRGAPTALHDRVLAALRAREARDLVLVVYEPGFDKARVAALAPLCDEAAESGDAVALAIVEGAARDLAAHVLALARRLAFDPASPFPVVLVGSVFQSERVRGGFERAVRAAYPAAAFVTPSHPPVVGALRLAAELLRDPEGTGG